MHPAEQYIEDVLSGKAVVGKWVRKAVERHVADLKRPDLEFKRDVAVQACEFAPLLCHSKGEWAGQPFEQEPWQQFIDWCLYGWHKDGFRRFIELAHGFGILVMHHTCGSIRPLIPLFIEDGLDILQSLQPRAEGMDLAGIKRDFGSRIGLHGSVDIQQTMPRGTPQEVREEVRARMDAGKEGGGYIICTAHNLQVDVPTRNIVELARAYHDFGSYGVPRSGNWTTAA